MLFIRVFVSLQSIEKAGGLTSSKTSSSHMSWSFTLPPACVGIFVVLPLARLIYNNMMRSLPDLRHVALKKTSYHAIAEDIIDVFLHNHEDNKADDETFFPNAPISSRLFNAGWDNRDQAILNAFVLYSGNVTSSKYIFSLLSKNLSGSA